MVGNEFYKNLPENWLSYLQYLFNKIFDYEQVPHEWTALMIAPLYKKHDPLNPANYRFILLVNCIAKIFTTIINDRLTSFVNTNDLILEYQAGFRAFRGCIDNLFTLNALIQIHSRFKSQSIYCVFVDFQKAFDSVDHEILFTKLFDLEISNKFINILHSFYSQASACIKVNIVKTNDVRVSKGVLQHEKLSLSLFSLFLHDTEKFLHRVQRHFY